MEIALGIILRKFRKNCQLRKERDPGNCQVVVNLCEINVYSSVREKPIHLVSLFCLLFISFYSLEKNRSKPIVGSSSIVASFCGTVMVGFIIKL